MAHGGQTLNDRLIAARHALAGQGLARVVCKATTEEVIGPKKKHLDYLLHCTNEPNVSIPQLANLLIERTQHSSWVVVFKALVTVHHLMCYGNERFTQYLASSNSTFQLSNFLDKTGVQGYDMSTFVRRYAKYLNEKAVSYRTVAFDFCKVKRGKEDGTLRTMSTDKLLKTLPVLQNQLDALVEFDCTANDLTNGVINACFMLLFRDLIRLFACYNDGIINLLEKYFDMNKKNCREALDIYKKFLIRMDRVGELLKVAENVGIDKGDIPDLTKAPSSLLDALEQHLATLEGKKIPTSTSSAASAIGGGTTSPSAGQEVNGVKVDESLRKAVEEEAVVMNQLKLRGESPIPWEQPQWVKLERRLREMQSQSSGSTNPFLSSPSSEQAPPQVSQPPAASDGILDLFSSPPASATRSGPVKASDDLLCLSGNPFASNLFGDSQPPAAQPAPAQPQQPAFPAFATNGFSGPAPSANAFASDASFAAAFGDNTTGTSAVPSEGTPQVSAPNKPAMGGGLTLPVSDPFRGRSATPSPTAELMRGAGTTPILSQAPESGFGDLEDTEEPTSQPITSSAPATDGGADIWGSAKATSLAADANPFGSSPFEPPASSAPAANAFGSGASQVASSQPAQSQDLFGLTSTSFGSFEEQTTSAPMAPPPSPFGGFDMGGGQAPAAPPSSAAIPPEQQAPPASAFDDLNMAIQKAMQPQQATLQQAPVTVVPSPMMSPMMSAPRPSGMPLGQQRFPFGQPPPAVPSGMVPGVPPTSHFESVSMARASPTPSYGTPSGSGASTPAVSVAAGIGGFDAFGDVLQPQPAVGGTKAFGTVDPTKPAGTSANSLIKGDLDSSLASLAQNLDINGPKQGFKKPGTHQWGSPKTAAKTGGNTWNPAAGAPPMGYAPAHGFQPMGTAPQWGGAGGMMAGPFPQQAGAPGMMPQQPFAMGNVRPPVAPGGVPVGMGMMPNASMAMSMPSSQPASQPMGMFPVSGAPTPAAVPAPTSMPSSQASDPFGAL